MNHDPLQRIRLTRSDTDASYTKGFLMTLLTAFILGFIPTYSFGQQQVTWENPINVVLLDDTVKKTTPDGYDAGVSSINQLKAGEDGWVEFVYGQTSTNLYCSLGFASVDLGADPYAQRYSFAVTFNTIRIVESSTLIGSYGTLLSTDTLRITRTADTIYYTRNGVLLRQTPTDPDRELIIDMALSSQNKYVSNVRTNIDTVLRVDGTVTDVLPPATTGGSIVLQVKGGKSPYTYLWSNAETTATITNLASGTYTVTVTDYDSEELIKKFFVGHQILWANEAGIDSTNGNFISSTVTAFDVSGASTKNYLELGEEGWIEYLYYPRMYFYIGLTPEDYNYSGSTIRYSIYNAFDNVRFLNNYNQVYTYSKPKTGDRIRIELYDDSIRYKINGTEIYKFRDPGDGPYIIDVGMGIGQPKIYDIRTNLGTPYGLFLNTTGQTPGEEHTGTINVDVRGGAPPYSYYWSDGGNTADRTFMNAGLYYLTVVDDNSTSLTKTIDLGYACEWHNLINSTVDEKDLQKTTGTNGYNAGASSKNYLRPGEDGEISLDVAEVRNNQIYAFGFGTEDASTLHSEIDYTFNVVNQGLNIFESGILKLSKTGLLIGDEIKIGRQGDSIRYYWNDTLLRTIYTDPAQSLFTDVAISGSNTRIYSLEGNLGHVIDSSVVFWTGADNSIWANAANWSFLPCGPSADTIPDSAMTAIFNGCADVISVLDDDEIIDQIILSDGYSHWLDEDTYTLTIKDKAVVDGAAISLSENVSLGKDLEFSSGSLYLTDYDLDINGDLIITGGEINLGEGTLTVIDSIFLNGGILDCDTGSLAVQGKLALQGGTFHGDMADVQIDHDLQIIYGYFLSTSEDLSLGGDLLDPYGFFLSNDGRVILTGSGNIQTKGALYDLEIAASQTATLQLPITVQHYLDLKGTLDMGENDLSLLYSGTGAIQDNGGAIRTEGEGFSGKIFWSVGTQTGTYSVPLVNAYNEDLSITVEIDTVGVGNGIMVLSTYPTDTDLEPLPPGLPRLYEPDETPEFDKIIQRYWLIDFIDYVTRPYAEITLHYVTRDYDGGALDANYLQLQRWVGYAWESPTGTVNTTSKTLNRPVFQGGVLVAPSVASLFSYRVNGFATLSRKLNGSYHIANDGVNFKYDEAYNDGNLQYAIYDKTHTLVFGSSLGHGLTKTHGDNRYFIRCHCYPTIFDDGEFYTLIVTNEKGEEFMLRFRYFRKQTCIQVGGLNLGLYSGGN